MGIFGYFLIYLFGGVTFVPICIISGLFFLKYYLRAYPGLEEKIKDDDLSPFSDKELTEKYRALKATELEEKQNEGVNVYKTGWLTVTAEYFQLPSTAAPDKPAQPNVSNSSTSALYNLVKGKAFRSNETSETEELDPEKSNNSGSGSGKRPRKNRYFAVLRHGNLFLYKDEILDDVLHVIVLSNYVVSIWPRNIPDGQLFSKISAICLIRKNISMYMAESEGLNYNHSSDEVDSSFSTFEVLEKGITPPKNTSFFLYPDRNYDKEDWYFDLIRATKSDSLTNSDILDEEFLLNPSVFAETLHPRTADMISLIQNLYSSEGQLNTRWFNSIIGRVFLAVYKTEKFENAIKNKLTDKLQKINKPGFLEEFKIETVFVGRGAPLFGSPKLVGLTPEGQLDVETSILYSGGISFEVSTKVNINLGTRFKQRDISILLAVTVKNVKGVIKFQVKKPPSNRLWWCFSEMPDMDIEVEPAVSSRQITTGMITRTIENRLKASIKESLVYPSMDDLAFFSTTEELFRGGIWDKKNRKSFSEDEVNEFIEKRYDSDSMQSVQSKNGGKSAETKTKTTKSEEKKPSTEMNTCLLDQDIPRQTFVQNLEFTDSPKVVIGAQHDINYSSNSSIFNFKNKDIREKAANTFRNVTKVATSKMGKVNGDIYSYKIEETDRQGTENLVDLSNDLVTNDIEKDDNENLIYRSPKMISSRRKIKHINNNKNENNTVSLETSITENSPSMESLDNNSSKETSSNISRTSASQSSISQPYMKVPEMSFPVRSPSKGSLDAFDASNNSGNISYVRRPPPKDYGDNTM